MFTAEQARKLQLEGDARKRYNLIDKIKTELRNCDDNDLKNILHDLLLIAQTQCTKVVYELEISNTNLKELANLGYCFDWDDELCKHRVWF